MHIYIHTHIEKYYRRRQQCEAMGCIYKCAHNTYTHAHACKIFVANFCSVREKSILRAYLRKRHTCAKAYFSHVRKHTHTHTHTHTRDDVVALRVKSNFHREQPDKIEKRGSSGASEALMCTGLTILQTGYTRTQPHHTVGTTRRQQTPCTLLYLTRSMCWASLHQ